MPFIRRGYCCLCGDCCNRFNLLGGIFVTNPDIHILENGYCGSFDKKTRRCKIYSIKPKICSKFPTQPNEIVGLANCTYWFIWVDE